MARQLGPGAALVGIRFAAPAPISAITTGPTTSAHVCIPVAGDGNWSVMNSINSGGTRVFEFEFADASNYLEIYNAVDEINSISTTPQIQGMAPSDGWSVFVCTKTTTACKFYWYKYSTNTWLRALNGAGTVDTAGGDTYNLGYTQNGMGTAITQVAASAIWHREMSQGEIDRLPRGNWWTTTPDWHLEFPSGVDNPALTKDIGRHRLPLSSDNAASTRSAVPDPPAFKFSPFNRRR